LIPAAIATNVWFCGGLALLFAEFETVINRPVELSAGLFALLG